MVDKSRAIAGGISKEDSLNIKGFALLLLLLHHTCVSTAECSFAMFHPWIVQLG